MTQVVEEEFEVSAPPDVVGGEQRSPSSLGLLEEWCRLVVFSYFSLDPVDEYVAPVVEVSSVAPAPVDEYVAPVVEVFSAAHVPVDEYVAPLAELAPVDEYVAPLIEVCATCSCGRVRCSVVRGVLCGTALA